MRAGLRVFVGGMLAMAALAGGGVLHSSSWGGTGNQEATSVAVDGSGNIYIAGWTEANDFPVVNAAFPRAHGVDAFLIKLDPLWNVVYSTFLGGESYDRATAVGVDAAGNVYVAGYTDSSQLGGVPFFQTYGGLDGFIVKIDATGSRVIYAKDIGGSGDDLINGMFIEPDGRVFVAGTSSSPDLPVKNAAQRTLKGVQNAFVAELDATGALVYCTWLGGSRTDIANGIAVDSGGSAWVAGSTTSPDFPAVSPVQARLAGFENAFVAKLSADGGALLFSSWLGGSGASVTNVEEGNAVAIDGAGNAWVAGITSSSDFPVLNAVQPAFGGWNSDVFLTWFDASGRLRMSTYLGGSAVDHATAVSLLNDGRVLVSGFTWSPDFPMVADAADWHGNNNGFLAEYNIGASALLFSTYVDRAQVDTLLAVSSSDPPIVVGSTKGGLAAVELASAVQVSVPALPRFTLAVSVSGGGVVSTAPSSADQTYASGTKVCLTAVPNIGSVFSGWSGNALDSSGCLVMIANRSVAATFRPAQYRLTLSVSPTGVGSISATPPPVSGTYAYGTKVCLTPTANAAWVFSRWSGSAVDGNACLIMTGDKSVEADFVRAGLRFVPVTPCRVADTRRPSGPFGGPALVSSVSRDFFITSGACAIPATAQAYALNVTVLPAAKLAYLTIWPAGQPRPVASTLNSQDGRIKANAVLVAAGAGNAISVFATDSTHVLLDISGYFSVTTDSSGKQFYTLPPCRIADTRNATGALGGPSLSAGQTREFQIRTACGIIGTPAAYALNFTVVPPGPFHYMSVWPAGESQPLVSTLNDRTGTVMANAAIVPAGSNGAIDVYATDNTDLVIDITGYFAAAGNGGLLLYALSPCRVLDTRNSGGQFSGALAVNMVGSTCAPPATARAFVLNATVVPPGLMGYLSLWPDGQPQPLVSTLNDKDGTVTSNMAIVPAANGSIDAFTPYATQLILDISGYFAP